MTDADQFEAFVRSYQDMVYAVAVRLLGNPAEAEDIAQTVFLKAFQRFDRYEERLPQSSIALPRAVALLQ